MEKRKAERERESEQERESESEVAGAGCGDRNWQLPTPEGTPRADVLHATPGPVAECYNVFQSPVCISLRDCLLSTRNTSMQLVASSRPRRREWRRCSGRKWMGMRR